MKTKLLSLALFLLVSFSMQAQPPSFSGVYAGSISSSSVTISCNVNGNYSLTGENINDYVIDYTKLKNMFQPTKFI